MVKSDGLGHGWEQRRSVKTQCDVWSGCSRRDRTACHCHDLLASNSMIPKLLKTSCLVCVC